jgi:hypothetical protein
LKPFCALMIRLFSDAVRAGPSGGRTHPLAAALRTFISPTTKEKRFRIAADAVRIGATAINSVGVAFAFNSQWASVGLGVLALVCTVFAAFAQWNLQKRYDEVQRLIQAELTPSRAASTPEEIGRRLSAIVEVAVKWHLPPAAGREAGSESEFELKQD